MERENTDFKIRQRWAALVEGYENFFDHRMRVRPVYDRDGNETTWKTCTPYHVMFNMFIPSMNCYAEVPSAGLIAANRNECDDDNDVMVWVMTLTADHPNMMYERWYTGRPDGGHRLRPMVWPKPQHVLTTSRVLNLGAESVPTVQIRSGKRKLVL